MGTIVLKLGGNVVLDQAAVAVAAQEIHALQTAGFTVCIVHGGGPQLDAALAQLGEAIQKVDGLRVTSKAASDVVRNVMVGIGESLSASLARHNLPATHVGLAWECFPSKVKDQRLGRVGTVTAFVPPEPMPDVAVITPLGFDDVGVLNVNADEGACAVAMALQADWLVLGTDVQAVRGQDGQSLERISAPEARRLVAQGTATGGMIPKLANAVAALESGVRNVLVTRIAPGFAASLLGGSPAGTLVTVAP